MDCFPIPFVCFQCGTDQNPCHCKIVGPTLGFATTVIAAVICWPGALLCGCCLSDTGKRMLAAPVDSGGAVNNAVPF
ncbi:hypothetical protein HO173_007659 [Letharia columbiana]|uniref:Uncharacterized protein n=1 Tax=Letharia columbiana TaxID=112416 RepID=A0A8H6FT72_9LECA|nr:uncharacterized protein HO173_007659 [Letharia columbiana]KAF6234239.1 hypothetical protein HO173_007659 [Letharia columbiana]